MMPSCRRLKLATTSPERYDEAIRDEGIPAEIVGILRNQAQAMVGTLDRIRALRKTRRAA